jgi:hypothetical protein
MMRPDDDCLKQGSVLMVSGTFTPPSVPLNLKTYRETWRVIGNAGGHLLDEDLRRAGWNLFFIAGVIRGYALGSGEGCVKRAMRHVLATVKAQGFNCAQVSDVLVKRFLGVPYVCVEAHSRHLQQSNILQTFKQRTQTSAAAAWSVG